MCGCRPGIQIVDAYNDVEIYVTASGAPVQYNRAQRPSISEFPEDPLFNMLTLYPYLGVYTLQTSETLEPRGVPYDHTVMTGRYHTLGDTIVCLPDVVYTRGIDSGISSIILPNDTINLQYTPVFRPRHYRRLASDKLEEITPIFEGLFDYELDILNRETGYVWTLKDYDFKQLTPYQREKLHRLSDPSKQYVKDVQRAGSPEISNRTIYYRVPFKIKCKTAHGVAGYGVVTDFYTPVIQ